MSPDRSDSTKGGHTEKNKDGVSVEIDRWFLLESVLKRRGNGFKASQFYKEPKSTSCANMFDWTEIKRTLQT